MENMNRRGHEKDQNHKGTMKHGFMMILCCLIPILLIAAFPIFGIKGGFLSSLVFLICPLMHIGMIFMMRKKGDNSTCHGEGKNENIELESKSKLE